MNKIEGSNKSFRLLNIYERFCRGEKLSKEHLAFLYDVNKRSIQRDIADLNEYLYQEGSRQEIVFNHSEKVYELRRMDGFAFSDYDIFAICKVLFDSRAFSKEEMTRIIDTLLTGASERKVLEEIIRNESFHYIPPRHEKNLINTLGEVSQSIRTQQVVEVCYIKQDGAVKNYEIEPLGLIFNEFYFYLVAKKIGDTEKGSRVYRLDRFEKYNIMNRSFEVPYKDRFQEGVFRKKIQFMYTGPLITIVFKFWGDSLEAVLDRLPTAQVIGEEGEKAIIRAEVYGEGVKRWLLSQKEFLEVIKPEWYREDIKRTVQKMAMLYNV